MTIANSNLQCTTNVDLIVAKETKKKQSNQQKGKQYAYSQVLNKETIHVTARTECYSIEVEGSSVDCTNREY